MRNEMRRDNKGGMPNGKSRTRINPANNTCRMIIDKGLSVRNATGFVYHEGSGNLKPKLSPG